MAGIGSDIGEVYDELGAAITIINHIPIVHEKMLYEINAQGTKPFIREHHLDCTFPYNTSLVVGDIIFMSKTDRYYMVMNLTPELFEDEIVEYSGVIYLCNLPLTAHIVRPYERRNQITYNMISGWQVIINSPVYGLLSDRLFGSQVEAGPIVGQDLNWRIDLYIPKWYDIKPLDRLIISDTEYYKIESIQAYNYPGTVTALLVEDTREISTIIDDEVYND
jgi:hypothetical protein